ncbi:hypothetical protein [Lysinibacillus sp. JNUCC-52]|uniref:hypothetical protein n=1 Tax=Lysinibacillus sp. JNUCC-52 TaxID=2792480 RepID=UPI00193562B8|nr:hypothetical protein JNUCC52_02825 [Lysinibacillus sp. JNUCC-52]
MNWYQIFVGVLPLLGVIVGGGITFLTQNNTLNKQMRRDSEKEKESQRIEKFLIYNDILKLDGEFQMQFYAGGGFTEFNIKNYRENFRPIFFSKYHLLDQEIAYNVREMDRIIMAADFFEEIEREQNDQLLLIFDKILTEIENILKEYRLNNMN